MNALPYVVLVAGAVFTALWYLDHRTHLEIWRKDITDGELRTHRMILYASYGLLASLLLMALSPWAALPLFVGAWITRTTHEAIDEFRWHLPRCTERETLIHLGMWISIHTGTTAMFIWGFVRHYEGVAALPAWLWAAFALVVGAMLWIGHHEMFDYRVRDNAGAAGAAGEARATTA